MQLEVESDVAAGVLYESPRLSARGRVDYLPLLLTALDTGDDLSLAAELNSAGRLNTQETAVRNGKAFTKTVPVTAPETLAEGEFNRYYAGAQSAVR